MPHLHYARKILGKGRRVPSSWRRFAFYNRRGNPPMHDQGMEEFLHGSSPTADQMPDSIREKPRHRNGWHLLFGLFVFGWACVFLGESLPEAMGLILAVGAIVLFRKWWKGRVDDSDPRD